MLLLLFAHKLYLFALAECPLHQGASSANSEQHEQHEQHKHIEEQEQHEHQPSNSVSGIASQEWRTSQMASLYLVSCFLICLIHYLLSLTLSFSA